VLAAPRPNGLKDREDSFAVIGNAVLDAWRNFRVNRTANQTLVLQAAQRCGQYLMRDVGINRRNSLKRRVPEYNQYRQIKLHLPPIAFSAAVSGHFVGSVSIT
jgi:hypothetical protein